jgi:hypothetical protein
MRTSPIHQNKARFWILEQYRGYRQGRLLFSGFPSDVTWRRVALEPNEFDRLRYAKEGGANRVDSPRVCSIGRSERTVLRSFLTSSESNHRSESKAELTEAPVDWRQLYTAAILNTDSTCFEVVLDEVACAMDVRLTALRVIQGDTEERREIALAAKSLLIMRAELEESKLAER